MATLSDLLREINAGVEIYYAGRTGGQYWKTAYILCDDYVELTSKLFLVTSIKKWTDKKSNGKFKNFYDILKDVAQVIKANRPDVLGAVESLHAEMRTRRDRRNDFFHSTHLLDLSVVQAACVVSFCDLLDYGRLLFPDTWDISVAATANLETYDMLLRLERKTHADPSLTAKINHVLESWPRTNKSKGKNGCEVTAYPEDAHLRLCVIYGRKELRDKLRALF